MDTINNPVTLLFSEPQTIEKAIKTCFSVSVSISITCQSGCEVRRSDIAFVAEVLFQPRNSCVVRYVNKHKKLYICKHSITQISLFHRLYKYWFVDRRFEASSLDFGRRHLCLFGARSDHIWKRGCTEGESHDARRS